MQYRQLGATGLKVSRLGFGALHINSSVGDQQFRRMIERSAEAGINYIDTARGYGESEGMLGKALGGLREQFVISTKSISRELETVKKDLALSLELLGTDFVDLYFLHDVSQPQAYERLMNQGVYEYLSQVREQGLIRHICMSTHNLEIAKRTIASGDFACIMLGYNLSDRSVEAEVLRLAAEAQVGTVIMKPLGGGVLCGERGKQHGVEIAARDLIRFTLSHECVDTVIPGVDRFEYLQECIRAEEMPPLSRAERKRLTKEVEALGTDFCRGCAYCEPCANDVGIREIMQLYSRYRVFQGVNWQATFAIKQQLGAYADQARECEACKECVQRCPFDLPIADVMNKIASS